MRWRLARLIGLRRTKVLFTLLSSERRARQIRKHQDVDGLSRRRFLGAAGGGAAVTLLGTGGIANAAPDAASRPRVAQPGAIRRFQATRSMESAERAHGTIRWDDTLEVSSHTGERFLILRHHGSEVFTVSDLADDPTIISIGRQPNGDGIRFYSDQAEILCDAQVSEERRLISIAIRKLRPRRSGGCIRSSSIP